MPTPKIAIIGAGPAGLTLARLLQTHSLPATIFEADTSATVRNQGGTLDLHPRAGQRALKEAGLFAEFAKYARPEGEKDKIVRFDGRVLWDENVDIGTGGESGGRTEEFADRPEIERARLREILLHSVEPETIRWGSKLIKVESTESGQHDLHFEHSIERGWDLVVGADGAWSKVRSLLSDTMPHYSGISAIELWAFDVAQKHPALSEYVGAGSMFMFDTDRALIAQRNGPDAIRTYACVRKPETWVKECGVDWTDREAAKKALVEGEGVFADLSPELKNLVLDSSREPDEELIPRALYMLPIGYRWPSKPGVTLLGDAAHLMTPFAGVGVNLAMADALELARELIKRKDSVVAKAFSDRRNIEAAVKAYEKGMWERGEEYAGKTWEGLQEHFSATGGEERVGKLRGQVGGREGAGK